MGEPFSIGSNEIFFQIYPCLELALSFGEIPFLCILKLGKSRNLLWSRLILGTHSIAEAPCTCSEGLEDIGGHHGPPFPHLQNGEERPLDSETLWFPQCLNLSYAWLSFAERISRKALNSRSLNIPITAQCHFLWLTFNSSFYARVS